jgi:hypothetical protein
MKHDHRDYLYDGKGLALRYDTVAFLLRQRDKIGDVLIDCLNECGGDPCMMAIRYPELCQEDVHLERQIKAELKALTK